MKALTFRHTVVLVIMLLAAFGVSARVMYVHLYQNEFLKKEGERHYKRNIPLYSYRGNILDSQGRELAVSAPSVSIWADPSDLQGKMDEISALAGKIGLDFYSLKRRLEKSRNKGFIYLKRQVSPEVINIVKSSGIKVVGFINERKRVYPEGSVFSHVIGVTDVDGKGVEGVELAFNSHLRGVDGVKSVIRDRLGRNFEIVDIPRQKMDGKDITLSIDRNIQYIAYGELRSAIAHHGAKSGMIVVLDVHRGKILSMVNHPTYNPNERKNMNPGVIRNRVVTDLFEPGSAIKPFIVAAGLEEGVIDISDKFRVSPGYINVAGKRISDSRNYHELDLPGVLAKSSNVGMVKISERISDSFLAEKLRDYGLFSSSGVELPGEVGGLFKSPGSWSSSYKNFLSFGYGAALSTLQLANAYLVLANEGIRRDVSILKNENDTQHIRVMDKRIAKLVVGMLRKVVSKDGTGIRADTVAYHVAGKTGTAKKIRQGVYMDDAYIAVFCGIAPANNPDIVIAVVIDDPRKNGIYGGQVAAPVFSKVASRILRYLDVPPDKRVMASVTALSDSS